MVCKAVFLDRDGTINVDKNYLYKIEDFEFIPGVIEALRIFQDKGYKLFIITNQSCIARGYCNEEDVIKLNDWMKKKLEGNGIYIEKIYYCPHLPNALISKYRKNCECRKPKLGLFNQAVKEFDVDLNQSIAIGDKQRDLAICEKSGCRGFIVPKNAIDNKMLGIAKQLDLL
ncbi:MULTISPECIES: HAD family hydrolase [unclassified Clostridium]|uniref:D-glycero-alpha-D-manno-heptose-1,7-bisphosphate 7-phosphatase n=1 Tax=unclassified Clostridium TaxID=2614128 RepID=UPI0002984AAB|nr:MULTISPECIES: HAD family hydrolase [unclassified Clostridium]EKQ56968.1 MAG: D,D-heptose 1,7-bisphosphate phosphatase [Clostridium sp. Maddingley MBC34-26]